MLNIPLKPLFLILRVIHSTVYYGRMLIWNTDKNFLKMCVGKINSEYIYIN
jgi:hypothetical protein